jgi:hypothetical protein
MAGVLKLERGGTEVDLNGGASDMDGFIVQDKFWDIYPFRIARTGTPSPPPIVEKPVTVLAVASTVDGLATHMQGLHQMQRWALEYDSPVIDDPVWLHAQWDEESGERRSFIREIRIQPGGPDRYKKDDSLVGMEVKIVFVRNPFWERASVRRLPEVSPSAAPSILYDYTGTGTTHVTAEHDIVGDAPARMAYFFLTPQASDDVGRLWCGIRSDGGTPGGDAANFVTAWELEDGTMEDADATAQTDGSDTASPYGGTGDDHEQTGMTEISISLARSCSRT